MAQQLSKMLQHTQHTPNCQPCVQYHNCCKQADSTSAVSLLCGVAAASAATHLNRLQKNSLQPQATCLLKVQLDKVSCRQQGPGLVLQVEPAAVTASTQGNHLTDGLLFFRPRARRAAAGAAAAAWSVSSCTTVEACLLLLLLCLVCACCDKVVCHLPHHSMPRPCAPVYDGRLAAHERLVQQRQHLVLEVT